MDRMDRIPLMLVASSQCMEKVRPVYTLRALCLEVSLVSLCKEEIGNHIAVMRLWPSSYPLQAFKGETRHVCVGEAMSSRMLLMCCH